MRVTGVLKQWLEDMKWDEQPEIRSNRTSLTSFGYSFEDMNVSCFFEVDDANEMIGLFMYVNEPKCPEGRVREVLTYFTALNLTLPIGNMQLLLDRRVARFYAAIDVTNASLEPAHITNLMRAGVRTLSPVLPNYLAVCFGGRTAEEVL